MLLQELHLSTITRKGIVQMHKHASLKPPSTIFKTCLMITLSYKQKSTKSSTYMPLSVYMSFYYTNTYMNLKGKGIVSTDIFNQISGALETPPKKRDVHVSPGGYVFSCLHLSCSRLAPTIGLEIHRRHIKNMHRIHL
jgi:hypothetical protein